MTDDIRAHGGEVRLNAPVTRLRSDGRPDRRGRRRRRDADTFVRDLIAAAANDRRNHRARGAGRGPRRGPRPALPRLPHRAAGDRQRGSVPRQLDLHPRPERARAGGSRTSAPGARGWSPTTNDASIGMEYFCFEGDDLWTMADDDARRVRHPGDPEARPGESGEGQVRVRRPRAQGLPDLRRRVRRAGGHDPRLARRDPQPDPGRPQRPASLQQLGPLDADRDARRRQHPARDQSRHLGRQRRERLPRGARRARAALPRPRPRRPRWSSRWRRRGRVVGRATGLCGLLGDWRPDRAAVCGRGRDVDIARRRRWGRQGPTPSETRSRLDIPQSQATTPTTTTATTATTGNTGTSTSGGSGLSGSDALVIVGFAGVLLVGVSFFIWRDARRRAPVRARAAAAGGPTR